MSYFGDFWTTVQSCLACFQTPSLVLNNRRLAIEKLLGEGGFAYVYLVQDQASGEQFALKKIRCPFGAESVSNAMREVNACKRFRKSPLVISSVDSSVRQDDDGIKTVYLLLPFYKNGNLQDLINDNAINDSSFTEKEIVEYTIGILKALRVMHHYRIPGEGDGDDEGDAEQDRLLDNVQQLGDQGVALGEAVPYAHRDIKPANIMIDDEKRLVLMDLGSCSRARQRVETRQQALELQDLAAEHCTLPYRAPELLDVKTGQSVDERVDIWSLGCTIYALMYSISPFERAERDTGASMNLAIANRRLQFPDQPRYSQGLKDLVETCLTTDPTARPNVDEVLEEAEKLQSTQ